MASARLLPRLAESLFRGETWPSQAAIAESVGAAPGSLHPWLQALVYQRVLLSDDNGFRVDRDRLLRYFSAVRIAAMRPVRAFTTSLQPEEIHARLTEAGIAHAFGFFTAANLYAFFEPRREIQLFIAPGSREAVRLASAGRNLVGDDSMRVEPFEEPLSQLGILARAGLPITAPLQTVLDLRAHPEGGAHADFLEKNLLPRILGGRR